MAPDVSYVVVVPTLGRSSLHHLLEALAATAGPRPEEIIVVVDGDARLLMPAAGGVRVLRSAGRGPAAARNAGWRAAQAEWVVFLDDDVTLPADWAAALAADLRPLGPGVAGSQARITVPLPADRRPTDWERNTAGLEHARWATADMAYRRRVLAELGGFDERFVRAYREDAELALRVLDAGYGLVRGGRHVVHPPRRAPFFASVRAQAGNADDALIRRLHGRTWRARSGAPAGRFTGHVVITTAGVMALAGLASSAPWWLTTAALATWALGTAEFAVTRVRPGPRNPAEIARMVVTSVLIPPAAAIHRLRGEVKSIGARPRQARPAAVLFDRDGTLIHNVHYNGNPDRVRPIDGAAAAVGRLRAAGVPVGVVTNQSGIAKGLLDAADMARVNQRVDELIGPFDTWRICPHDRTDGCRCRKPRAGLVEDAAHALGVPAWRCVVIGDIGTDVEAARAASARGILVPSSATESAEVAAAPEVVPDLHAAVRLILGEGPATGPPAHSDPAASAPQPGSAAGTAARRAS